MIYVHCPSSKTQTEWHLFPALPSVDSRLPWSLSGSIRSTVHSQNPLSLSFWRPIYNICKKKCGSVPQMCRPGQLAQTPIAAELDVWWYYFNYKLESNNSKLGDRMQWIVDLFHFFIFVPKYNFQEERCYIFDSHLNFSSIHFPFICFYFKIWPFGIHCPYNTSPELKS